MGQRNPREGDIPAKLTATRLTSYLAGRGKDTLTEVIGQADAVTTFWFFRLEEPL
ncbi:hypothetical protein [Shinella sp.]|uniref:hypothetical protein n=1 Tax=Shinella sp. TaxID=1870904 RepID=UPI004036015E